jgi:hypothetical protein
MTTKENANTGSVVGTISENSFFGMAATATAMFLRQKMLHQKSDLLEIGAVCAGVLIYNTVNILGRVALNKAKPMGRELCVKYTSLLRTRYGKTKGLLRTGSEQSIDIAEKEAAL